MTDNQNKAAALMGALVADAASLGQHWIYDIQRIEDITEQNGGMAAFTPIDAENYAETEAYFAHGQRRDGMLSQYGETLRLAIRSMIEHGGQFEIPNYQKDYAEFFGPGGSYQGYIDGAMAGTLKNIANDVLEPSGVDDHQHPAITSLPAIVLGYGGAVDFSKRVDDAVRVTNVHAEAASWAPVFANLLNRVFDGAEIKAAMQTVLDEINEETSGDIKTKLDAALNCDEENSIAYGETTGRACYLNMGIPLSFHILNRAQTFEEAVETNILAGGDSAGRAIMIGAVMGAKYGIAGEHGVPLNWILSTHDSEALWLECQTLAELS